MTMPRRQIIRASPPVPPPDPQRTARLEKVRFRLKQERAALARWMARLKRAFHRVEAQQRTVARLERRLSQLED